MMKTPEDRAQELLDLGMTQNEVEYITTPVAKLNREQISIALAINDKKFDLMRKANELYADEKARDAALKRAENGGVEFELDDGAPAMSNEDAARASGLLEVVAGAMSHAG